MASNRLVTVITIFFNTEKFIEEAIKSVFAQTYDNWELLLVDDGSTDRSTEIALQYVQEYPEKVRYLEHDGHQNRGMSATRNLGISNAKGEYIALLDSDDVWLPHKLEQQIAIMDSFPEAAMVYGTTQKWYSWTGNPEDIQLDHLYELGIETNTLVQPPTLFNLFLQGKTPAPCTCSLLARREVVEKIGGFEDSFRGMYEDQAFYTKMFLKAPVFVASGYWDRYRKHPNSCVSGARQAGQADAARLFFLNWLEKYLSEQEVKDINVWKVLSKELYPYRYPIVHRLSGRIQQLVCQMKGTLKRILNINPIVS